MSIASPVELTPYATALFSQNRNAAYTGPRFADGASVDDVVDYMESHSYVEPIKRVDQSVSLAMSYPGYAPELIAIEADPGRKKPDPKPTILKTTSSLVVAPEGDIEVIGSAQINGCFYACVTCPSGDTEGFNASPEQLHYAVHSAMTRANPPVPRDQPFDLFLTGEGDNGANAGNVLAAIPYMKQAFPGLRLVRVSTVGSTSGLDKFADAIQNLPVALEVQLSLHFANDRDRNEWAPKPEGMRIEKLLEKCRKIYDASVAAGKPQKIRINWMVFPGKNDDPASLEFLRNLDPDVFYLALVPANKTNRQVPDWANVECAEDNLRYVEEQIAMGDNPPSTVREIDYAAKILGAGCAQVNGNTSYDEFSTELRGMHAGN